MSQQQQSTEPLFNVVIKKNSIYQQLQLSKYYLQLCKLELKVGRVVVEGPEEVIHEVLQDALENKWDAEMVENQLCIFSQFGQNQKVNDQCKLRQFKETGTFEEAVRAWFQKRL
ncbi:Hypothetical_protein [Hexamita inflata]|uniref:Hypothetical_protein n=1 Tax=Hexamita inflata TaxID=28002 RepID=A0AA86UHV3_9EUKA|nr:Hypothetical protein HINF_LOCUS28368 [Hexamita inflata]